MPPPVASCVWEVLEVHAHLPEIQCVIRAEIKRGVIRVAPGLGGAIRIIPLDSAYRPDPGGWPTVVLRALGSRASAPTPGERRPSDSTRPAVTHVP